MSNDNEIDLDLTTIKEHDIATVEDYIKDYYVNLASKKLRTNPPIPTAFERLLHNNMRKQHELNDINNVNSLVAMINSLFRMLDNNPDYINTLNIKGLSIDAKNKTLTINDSLRIVIKGNFHITTEKHMRIDASGKPVEGKDYLYSVFLNSTFENDSVDSEPVLPKYIPYLHRPRTLRIKQMLGKKKRPKHKSKCGCGCH